MSAANGCTRSLGGMETPEPLVVARVPGVIVPVGVVKGVRETPRVRTPCVSGAACAKKTARVCEQPCGSEARCVSETPRVSDPAGVSGMAWGSEARCESERRCVRKTACVRSLCVREMSVGMRMQRGECGGVNVMSCSTSLVTRRSAWVERRRRLRQLRDKGRVVAVVLMGTVPGWHSSERAVRAVPRTRPPRARLRE